jgi:predicted CXXCH cytochrome family protein
MTTRPSLPACTVFAIVLGACVLVWINMGSPSLAAPDSKPWFKDPRLSYKGPYKNVDPGVKYVGDQVCATCHESVSKKYRQHPMGNSLSVPSENLDDTPIDEKHNTPFKTLGLEYRVRQDGKDLWHEIHLPDPEDPKKELGAMKRKVSMVLGAGVRARVYLLEKDGFVFESPISWYAGKEKWDLSAGYESSPDSLQFKRPIGNSCLFCHANHVDLVPGYFNRFAGQVYQGAIGCERCHGPGELHAKERKESPEIHDIDDTIVNPSRLALELREAICQQCHLIGDPIVPRPGLQEFDFRPGLPLQQFVERFLTRSEEKDADPPGHVQQMYSSKCFQESRRKDAKKGMGCTSCHDPHEVPAKDKLVDHYRKGCLACHGGEGKGAECVLPRDKRIKQQADDSCTACHMPKNGGDRPHVALSDHTIPRTKEKRKLFVPKGDLPIVSFHADLNDSSADDVRRTLAIACAEYMWTRGATREGSGDLGGTAKFASEILAKTVKEYPEDQAATLAYAYFLTFADRKEQALAVAKEIAERWPKDELALARAIDMAQRFGDSKSAIKHWRSLVELSPSMTDFRASLFFQLASDGDWAGAIEQYEAIRRSELDDGTYTRQYVEALYRTGRKSAAEMEFNRLLKLRPGRADELKQWWKALH